MKIVLWSTNPRVCSPASPQSERQRGRGGGRRKKERKKDWGECVCVGGGGGGGMFSCVFWLFVQIREDGTSSLYLSLLFPSSLFANSQVLQRKVLRTPDLLRSKSAVRWFYSPYIRMTPHPSICEDYFQANFTPSKRYVQIFTRLSTQHRQAPWLNCCTLRSLTLGTKKTCLRRPRSKIKEAGNR